MDKPAQDVDRLFPEGRRFTYRPGGIIFGAGDVSPGVFYIVSGWVEAYYLGGNGEPDTLMGLHAGDIFPVTWAVGGELGDSSFAALAPTEIWRIPRTRFTQAVQNDYVVASAAMDMLARQCFTLTRELESLEYRSARERVIFRLLLLADQLGKWQRGQLIIDQYVPDDYIARFARVTQEAASHEMSRLSHQGFIRQDGGRITIPDWTRLRNEIGKQSDLDSRYSLNAEGHKP